MGKKINVSRERPSVRKRVAASIQSKKNARSAKVELKQQQVLDTERAGYLTANGALERTTTVRQKEIRGAVDRGAATKGSFELDLSDTKLGPYIAARYSRSGRSLLIASERGHLAVTEWRSAKLRSEIYLNETVRDAQFLHSDRFLAVAQRQHAYIYDDSGMQLHVLREHRDPGRLVFLPHHLLLVSSSAPSSTWAKITYTDTTTGYQVASHDFRSRQKNLSSINSLCYNPTNGVLHAGHSNGVVSLWSPSSSAPLARLLAQPGGVRHVAVDASRNVMATLGHQGTLKEFDLRTFQEVAEKHAIPLATSMTYSHKSILAVSGGASVQVWKAKQLTEDDAKPYMTERYHGRRPTNLDFCPFEDVLAVCHAGGMCNMLVPGAGEATFDSLAPNPYQTRKQASNAEVRTLLDKLPADTIALDPNFIGDVDANPRKRAEENERIMHEVEMAARERRLTVRKAKGKNKIGKRVKRMEAYRIERKRLEVEEKKRKREEMLKLTKKIEDERDEAKKNTDGTSKVVTPMRDLPSALNRFLPKKKGENSSAPK